MRLTTPLHISGVSLLFISSMLLLLVTISSPILAGVGLLSVDLGNSTRKSHDDAMVFGTFGYCCRHCAGGGEDDVCTGRRIGYDPARVMAELDGAVEDEISRGASDALTRVMVLHPIACGVAFVAFLVSMGGGWVGGVLGALAAWVAWVLVVVVMATDFTLFGIVRVRVNGDASRSKARFGDAIWLLVASFIFLFAAMCILLVSCCAGRREKNRRGRAVDEAAPATRARGWNGRWFGLLRRG